MALSNVQRARIILDLLRDGVVSNEAVYSSVDLVPGATALKYATAIAEVPPGVTPTNDQLAGGLIRALRLTLRTALEQIRVPAAGLAAQQAELAVVRSETLAEIGE